MHRTFSQDIVQSLSGRVGIGVLRRRGGTEERQNEASLCQVAACLAFGERGELLRLVPGRTVLGFGLAREWPLRRAGASGCEPATLDTESFPDCPPGSLSVGATAERASATMWA